jgi:protease-4
VAVFDLSGGVPEQASGGLLGLTGKGAALTDLVHEVEAIEEAQEKGAGLRADVRGVLVRLGTARIGLARAIEIGAMLEKLGTKMPVYCHADEYGNGTLALAARACKRVWISPASSVDAIGIAAQTMYFHKLLVDQIGLDVDFLQVGKFKGAEEPFTRDGPSPEARESLVSTLADLRTGWLETFQKGRPQLALPSVEDGPYAPQAAKEHGLVDEVGYFDQARAALETAAGASRAEVLVGAGQPAGGGDGLAEVLRSVAGDSLGTAPVAIVPAIGAISMEGGGVFGGEGSGIAERRLVRTLTRLEKDDDVKAVVLRIDSPGGSALASDLLWHELMTIREKKTLVVSVGDMAASGGYYLASTGSVVFADATSIVGSIGVVGGKIAADRALERFGVHAETFAAKRDDPQAAARAAYESLIIPWDAATKARLLETMTGIYRLFLERVAEGRHIPVERVAASAEGRIFGGREGKTRGLVDEIGGLQDAIARARSMAGLAPDARVEVAGEGSPLQRILGEDDSSSDPDSARALAELGASLFRSAPELVPFVGSLSALAAGEHALCAVPFALTVR